MGFQLRFIEIYGVNMLVEQNHVKRSKERGLVVGPSSGGSWVTESRTVPGCALLMLKERYQRERTGGRAIADAVTLDRVISVGYRMVCGA
jgi:hypothetical protein